MSAFYNECEPYAAQWLRNLIEAGHIAPGIVDERSILDVQPDDLAGFSQCHFFAGIGGWSLALRLAGWADTRPVWTGSPPCQPFSNAGRGEGFADERHLWPAWLALIREHRPRRLFGEQVAGLAALRWWDAVRDDLERARYACAAADLCAAGVGAPHIRQRLFWLAQRLADDDSARLPHAEPAFMEGARRQVSGRAARESGRAWWRPCEWIACRDGALRPIEPGVLPVAHGVPARVGRLRAYGNAIVAPLAAQFILATPDEEVTP